jgi:hypothetical protein
VTVLTLAEAEDLAARTLAAIFAEEQSARSEHRPDIAHCAPDRERVASDLAGLRRYWLGTRFVARLIVTPYAEACSDNLRRTARLYGAQP